MLQAEQMAVYEANEGGKMPLTWGQTRNMPITHRVWYILYTAVNNVMQHNSMSRVNLKATW